MRSPNMIAPAPRGAEEINDQEGSWTAEDDAAYQAYEEQGAQTPSAEDESSSISGETSDVSSQETTDTITTEQETAQADSEPMTPDQLTDKEILGRSYPVRQMVKEANNQRMKLIEGAKMAWTNLKETPKLLRLNFRNWLADGRVARQNKRYEDAVKKTGENSRLAQRRRSKLEAAKKHKESISKDRDKQEETMLARERTVGENAEQRRNENIKELAERAIDAKARKALRHELREQGASRREVREILAGIPDEQKRNVGRAAIEHAIASKDADTASAAASKARAERSSIAQKLGTIDDYNYAINTLKKSLAEAQAEVDELTNRGKVDKNGVALGVWSRTDRNGVALGAWSPAEKTEELQAAKDRVAAIKDNIALYEKRLKSPKLEKASLEQTAQTRSEAWEEADRQEQTMQEQTAARADLYQKAVRGALQEEEQPQNAH